MRPMSPDRKQDEHNEIDEQINQNAEYVTWTSSDKYWRINPTNPPKSQHKKTLLIESVVEYYKRWPLIQLSNVKYLSWSNNNRISMINRSIVFHVLIFVHRQDQWSSRCTTVEEVHRQSNKLVEDRKDLLLILNSSLLGENRSAKLCNCRQSIIDSCWSARQRTNERTRARKRSK